MAQFGFYMAQVSLASPIFFGRLGVLIAWDPKNRGPSAADDPLFTDIALYSWIGSLPTGSVSVGKVKSKSPISIPDANCPRTLDVSDDGNDLTVRFGIKSGGSAFSTHVNGWLEVFEGSTRVYGIAPVSSTMLMELADASFSNAAEMSMQDQLTLQAMEDPPEGDIWTSLLGGSTDGKEIWRELITPNLPLTWL
jgi:hypothetical protein